VENKSYYAIIPAEVRYDEDLTPNAKLLYAEITALTNEKGYCWATNNYFAKLYKTSPITISRWIRALKEKGYITTDILYKEGTNAIDKRYIQICKEGINKNVNRGINKNVKENNININNKINNIYIPKWLNENIDLEELKEEEKEELSELMKALTGG
jgi:SOS-response transcriptional repressor LexA